jgi:hypothetical protein
VLPPEDQRTKEKRPAVVSASVSTCDLPAELKALAVRAGATWATRLRFAIEVLFGLPPGPRAWRADIGDSAARDVKEKLEPVPALGTLHHPTPGRPDDLARQRFSAVDLLNDPRSSELVAALETASAASVRALDRLLADDLRSFEVKLVEQALQALPGSWKLELCWPREQLDRDLLARLTPLRRRLIGLCDRVHVVGGIRARVVPSTGANHTSMTNLTTLTRAAVRAWLLTSTTATEE